MAAFDPYYKWLAIPPEEQPPDFYRLLGLSHFESDAEVIETQADLRMSFLQQMSTGPHVALSQQILNELSHARICLLDPQKKAEYDTELHALLGTFDFLEPEKESRPFEADTLSITSAKSDTSIVERDDRSNSTRSIASGAESRRRWWQRSFNLGRFRWPMISGERHKDEVPAAVQRQKIEPEEFDPYHKWLGILAEQQPANHYHLLGLSRFESDREVIETQADLRMACVQQMSMGPHMALSQQILNELSEARVCLLDTQKKAEYDTELHAILGTFDFEDDDGHLEETEFPTKDSVSTEPRSAGPSTIDRIATAWRASKIREFRWLRFIARWQREAAKPTQEGSPETRSASDRSGWMAPASKQTYLLAYIALMLILVAVVVLTRDPERKRKHDPPDRGMVDSGTKTKVPGKAPTPPPLIKLIKPAVPGKGVGKPPPPPLPDLLAAPFEANHALAAQQAWAEYLGSEVVVENSIGQSLALIPAGEFLMGSPADEVGRGDDEGPQHRVQITIPFYVGICEVTQAEWEAVMGMGSNPSFLSATGEGAERVSGEDTSDFPVEQVSWYDAIEFCNALSNQEELRPCYNLSNVEREILRGRIIRADVTLLDGDGYRLLTEAEWEYVCRAGTTTPFHFGTASTGLESNIKGIASNVSETEGAWLERTTNVASYSPNPFGIFDLCGNVWEWCWDTYDAETYNGRTDVTNDPMVNNPENRRVLRGGSWMSTSGNSRSAHRHWHAPSTRYSYNGFRIARTCTDAPGNTVGPGPEATTNAVKPARLVAPFDANEALATQQAWAEYLGTYVVTVNTIGMQLSLIPPGEFSMGSPETETGRGNNEGPQHPVRITQPFYVGTYEVTQEEWQTVMGSNPSWFTATSGGSSAVADEDTSRFPVEHVSWFDAVEFCNRLSSNEGLPEYYEIIVVEPTDSRILQANVTVLGGIGYRLLTEAEWEYACRAGTTTPFHFGSTSNGSESNVNGNSPYGVETEGPWLERPTTVGSYTPNPFGLFDLHGNVREWCWDGYDALAYKGRTETTSDPIVSNPESRRVLRGGSWISTPRNTRVANRDWYAPDDLYIYAGLRVSRTSVPGADAIAANSRDDSPALLAVPFNADQAQSAQQEWAEHLNVPATLMNSLGISLSLIPAGQFITGKTQSQIDALVLSANELELPTWYRDDLIYEANPHTVSLTQPYYMGRFEVTQQQFQELMGRNPSDFSESGAFSEMVADMNTDQLPIENVSWIDAAEFCNRLSEREGLSPYYTRIDATEGSLFSSEPLANGYRLPTEAEWEFGCRTGTDGEWWFGSDPTVLDQHEWTLRNSNGHPHPVGQLTPNPFGLCDMHGNVWEWCHDRWFDIPYDPVDQIDPGLNAQTYYSTDMCASRGGAFDIPAELSRASCRGASSIDRTDGHISFRVVLKADPVAVEQIQATTTTRTVSDAPAVEGFPTDGLALLSAPFDEDEAQTAQQTWADQLGTDVVTENSIEMKLTLIPPGEFLMGSPESEEGREADEGPQHRVRVTSPFYVATCEVTQAEWKAVMGMGSNPSYFTSTGSGSESVKGMYTSNFPVEQVTWYDCIEFCNTLSRKENLPEHYVQSLIVREDGHITGASVTIAGGDGYRLLSEAEWEYACRAGTLSPFHFGRTSNGRESNVQGGAPYRTNLIGPTLQRTTAVGTYSPNAFGLFDMHGNIYEWCWDAYVADAYNGRPEITIDPIVDRPTRRVRRGGAWSLNPHMSRSAGRDRELPHQQVSTTGFRIARTSPMPSPPAVIDAE